MTASSSSISLTPASIQGVAAELSHVLSGLQQSGELSTVLQQQPHLVEGMAACIACTYSLLVQEVCG